MFTVEVWLQRTSQPLVFEADSTYIKGPFYCVQAKGRVTKFPVRSIFRVIEEYQPRGSQ